MPDLISPFDMVPDDAPSPHDPDEVPAEAIASEDSAPDLTAVRELVLRAHPDVVPELVTGDSVADLIASVEPARAAYARLATSLAETRPAPTSVPAGGGGPIPLDPDRLPAAEKIRRGLVNAVSSSRKG